MYDLNTFDMNRVYIYFYKCKYYAIFLTSNYTYFINSQNIEFKTIRTYMEFMNEK